MSARRLQIVYSEEAQSDLRGILLYTETNWNDRQRATYEQLLRDTIRALASSPGLGRGRNELATGLRSYPVGSHVLYYRKTGTALVVARIMHSRQDPSREAWEQSPHSE